MDGNTITTVRCIVSRIFFFFVLFNIGVSHTSVSIGQISIFIGGDGIPKYVPVGSYHRTRDHITNMMDWTCEMSNGTVVGCNCPPYDMPATCNVSYYWNRNILVNHYCIIPPTTNNGNSRTNVKGPSQRQILCWGN